ncbi:ABC transporter permease [Prauserella sp. PE36]|uniref:ABC transporter permease n=1 Tax=Prauserella endophytica TaxID=1592324 RepID=A0ABY2S6N8_9PSEU|nr:MULTISPECIES: ABC transporter permease [Prauserella]RBM21823.1 ABC transporter permease [Prauserella sp. PE36]TKG70964.1 ABC transporter permease [Prauserella endophytica]
MKSSSTETVAKDQVDRPSAAPAEHATRPPEQARRRTRRMGALDLPVVAVRILIFVALIGVWYWSVEDEWLPRMYTATPMETFERLVEMVQQSSFWHSMQVTLSETLLGWVLGSSAGLIVGLILGRWNRLASIADPYLTFANATPKIALAPFFILWFGVGPSSKVVLAAVIVFFIVQVPTQAAVSQVPPDLNTVATTMGATELQKFRMVVLPGIMAPVFGALRLAAVYSLLAVVMGEFIAARVGLGQALITSTNQFDMRTAFALLIVLATLAVVINLGVSAIERRVLRWRALESSASSVSI